MLTITLFTTLDEIVLIVSFVLSKFDEDDLYQHMIKVLFGCGMFAAFCGQNEHTIFYTNQLMIRCYADNFENQELAGLKYAAINHMPSDKTNKVTVNNSYSRSTTNIMRFPIMEGDPNNFGGTLACLMEKFTPGQKRVYCKCATPEKRAEWIGMGYSKAEFFENLHLEEKRIAKLFKKKVEILGLNNVDLFRPHSLCGVCISNLVNSKNISFAETMHLATHNSASASKVYQRVDGISEGNWLAALGQMPAVGKKSSCKEDSETKKGYKSDSSDSTVILGLGAGKRKQNWLSDDSSIKEVY